MRHWLTIPVVTLLPTAIVPSNASADARYSCAVGFVSVHNDGEPSFQNRVSDPFSLNISRTKSADNVWCGGGGRMTGFRSAYCNSPYIAEIREDVKNRQITTPLYGDDEKTFRGFFPYEYLVMFDDHHFIRSTGLANGVMVQTGTCSSN
jgi:hypothetical protein